MFSTRRVEGTSAAPTRHWDEEDLPRDHLKHHQGKLGCSVFDVIHLNGCSRFDMIHSISQGECCHNASWGEITVMSHIRVQAQVSWGKGNLEQ